MILLPVLTRDFVSYPEAGKGPPKPVFYVPLAELLTEPADFDGHFCAYSVPEVPYRLRYDSLPLIPGGVPLVLAVFDVDGPNHEAPPAWRAGEKPKIELLRQTHPDLFVYETKGGYRIVGILAGPQVLKTSEDIELWKALYLTWCRYLRRCFKIEADTFCKDWTRLYRIPHATRDGQAPEQLPTYGDPSKIGIWDPDCDQDFVPPQPVRLVSDRPTHTDPPLPTRIALAREALSNLPPSVQGKGGDAALFNACRTVLVGFDLPLQDAAELIESDFDPRCEPPWGADLQERLDHNLTRLEENATIPWGYLLKGIAPEHVKDAGADPTKWKSTIDHIMAIGGTGPKMPTGIETLDKATRGGLRQGSFVVLGGAPGAGKTTLAVQLAWHYAKAGTPVAFIAADESPQGLLMRIGQANDIRREELEDGSDGARRALAALVANYPLEVLDANEPGVTLEAAAEALAKRGPGVLFVDSLQTTRTQTSHEAEGTRARIDDVVMTAKQVASLYGHVVVATSELARGAYRSKAQADQIDDLAAFKESGGIEYAGTVLMVLRTPGKGIVDVAMPKNRLGQKLAFRLEQSFTRATFKEVPMPEEAEGPAEEPYAMAMLRAKTLVWRTIHSHPDRFTSGNAIQDYMKSDGRAVKRDRFLIVLDELKAEGRIQKQGAYLNSMAPPL